jgi:tetratricopeptide (TPR) repeat protein/membrane protease YdiL (CAAX protease family)
VFKAYSLVPVLLALASAAGLSLAQEFSPHRYLDQCLRFEAAGDLDSARESCLNALEVNSSLTEALLATARIELALGDPAAAETRLLRIRNSVASAEPLLLLAEIALQRNELDLAEGYLTSAETQLAGNYNNELAARQAFLTGEVLQQRGRFQQALAAYRQASHSEPLAVRYHLAAARVLLALGLPEAAVNELAGYRLAAGEAGTADLHALLGRAQWAAGQLAAAAAELETATILRGGRDAAAQAEDLRSLAVIYFGQGDVERGNLALQGALQRGNLLQLASGNPLLWLLLLLLVAGTHLIGESRAITTSPAPASDPVRLWSVGQVYQVLVAGVLSGLLAALLYGTLMFGNYLAFFTPLQSSDTLAVFLIIFTLVAVAGAWRRTALNGWDPAERLFGSGDHLLAGVGLGVLLLAVTLLYLGFLPRNWGGFYFNLNQLSIPVVLALLIVPFSELFFRAFALPPLVQRYGGTPALIVSAGLYALVLGSPVLLLFILGLIVAAAYRNSGSGLLVFAAQLTLQVGLLLAVTFSSWAGTLFL